eukprot:148876_1
MSTQQKRSELLTFGYIKTAYKDCIPVQLIKLTQLFYDDWNYWLLKGAKLKQFVNSKAYEKITCTKSFVIKGIEFEMFSNPNGISSTHELDGISTIGVEIKYLPTNIKSFAFYTEIKCEALNHTLKKFVHISPSNKIYGEVMCQLSELKHMKTVCFDHVINIKYIKYKKDCKKDDYYSPINKMQKNSKFTWNINGLLLPKYHYKNYYGVPPEWHAVYSDNFGDNNWCVKFYPHRLTAGLYFMLLSFPPQVSKMDVKIIVDINGKTVENIDFVTREKHGRLVFFAHAQTNYVITATLEIINIYNIHHQIIEENKWSEFGIIIDSNTNQNGRKRKYEHEIDKEEFYMDDNIIGEPSKKRLKTNDNIYIVKDIKNWKFINGKCKFEVEWDGYDNKTWERIENVAGNDKWMKCVEN